MARVTTKPLTMVVFLQAVRDHKTNAREALIEAGYHPNVIYMKAEKAARKGYTEYGVVADRPWLEPAGKEGFAPELRTARGFR